MEYARKTADCCKKTAQVMAKDPPRTLRWASAISGLLLILGGVVGVFTINPLAAIISVYNFFFGVLIVITELKSYPIIRTLQRRIDVYFHLLSVPRGKGGFYCFIGFLAFFSSTWKDAFLAKLCVLIVSIVGLIHLLACKRCGGSVEEEMASADSARHQSELRGADDSYESDGSSWATLMKQVVSESPEILSAGITVATNPAAQSIAASMAGGTSTAEAASGAPADAHRVGGFTDSEDVPSCSRASSV